ncbi:mitochondrial P-loop-containing NTPase superfamily member [Andalucia godoyi]|uniref:Mitochondrial P-loop-containing NTPase superfamily member n=1 Tax=Andalucia godoyi TaxID=505711 RepID=A0A8K0AFW1_ANDGO|nr:mitochondrial P-loop-containing NTPase superfamily member [Andalucia godoyi]|eukprot:ANDGO_03003.mRNA.1 mitochondrial P-loop-containing NTPase superfamily member
MLFLRCKVALIGSAASGKSALLQVFHSSQSAFPKSYLMTMGAELVLKEVRIPDSPVVVELLIQDLGAQAIYDSVTTSLTSGDACPPTFYLLCVDTTSASMDYAYSWFDKHQSAASSAILVATKSDVSDRNVAETQALAETHGIPCFVTSAAIGKDVDAPFNYTAQAFSQMYDDFIQASGALRV